MKICSYLIKIICIIIMAFPSLFGQDTIVLKSGEEILVRIKELTPTSINYTKMDSVDNTTVNILRDDVYMIKYESGVKDVFHQQTSLTPSNKEAIVDEINIPAFSNIYIENLNELRSKSMHIGQEIPFRVTHDFIVDGQIIVAKGTLIYGKVTHLKEPKFLGKPGELEISVYEVETVNSTMLPLNRHIYKVGKDKSTEVIILGAALFWPILLIKGGEVVLEAHTPLRVESATYTN